MWTYLVVYVRSAFMLCFLNNFKVTNIHVKQILTTTTTTLTLQISPLVIALYSVTLLCASAFWQETVRPNLLTRRIPATILCFYLIIIRYQTPSKSQQSIVAPHSCMASYILQLLISFVASQNTTIYKGWSNCRIGHTFIDVSSKLHRN